MDTTENTPAEKPSTVADESAPQQSAAGALADSHLDDVAGGDWPFARLFGGK